MRKLSTFFTENFSSENFSLEMIVEGLSASKMPLGT